MIDPELLDLYSARLKELGAAVRDDNRLEVPDPPDPPDPQAPDTASPRSSFVQVTAHRRSPLCGSEVTLDLRLDRNSGTVQAIGYSIRACSLAAAASAIVIRNAPGSTLAELKAVRDALKAMLRQGIDQLPGGKWQDLDVLKPAHMVRARHGSALLPFDTVVLAMEEATRAASGETA